MHFHVSFSPVHLTFTHFYVIRKAYGICAIFVCVSLYFNAGGV